MISPYVADASGSYRAVIPSRGPCRDERPCRLGIKHFRNRKTGPAFPLTVLGCKTHGCCFTLYPPGHVPYGRDPLVLLSAEGRAVERDRGPPYQGTYFQAALDAVDQPAWPKESTSGSASPRFATQLRHLMRCCLLFGLAVASRIGMDRLGARLGIPAMIWQRARRWVVSQKGFRGKGQAIRLLLNLLPETHHSYFDLATLGHDAGFWPKPQGMMGLFTR